jgi:hypothetical protein
MVVGRGMSLRDVRHGHDLTAAESAITLTRRLSRGMRFLVRHNDGRNWTACTLREFSSTSKPGAVALWAGHTTGLRTVKSTGPVQVSKICRPSLSALIINLDWSRSIRNLGGRQGIVRASRLRPVMQTENSIQRICLGHPSTVLLPTNQELGVKREQTSTHPSAFCRSRKDVIEASPTLLTCGMVACRILR